MFCPPHVHDLMASNDNMFGSNVLQLNVNVATPLWSKCEDETCTPKIGNLESSGTPETLELNCRGQTTSPWGVLYIIGKVLKCKCRKWPRMNHSNIYSTKLWSKKGSGVWTSKSQELTQLRCVQVECDTLLENSWEELQVCFRPHPNQRSELGVISSQSLGSPN